MKNEITVKDILIKFMEWQMETNPLIANFTHNTVANKFLTKYPEFDENLKIKFETKTGVVSGINTIEMEKKVNIDNLYHICKRTNLGENARELYKIVQLFTNAMFVDLGVKTGNSSEILLMNAYENNNHVYGIDVDFSMLSPYISCNQNYIPLYGDSVTIGEKWIRPIDLIFIDTLHVKEQTLMELLFWYPNVKEGGYIILHDTNWESTKHDNYGDIVWDTVDLAILKFFQIQNLNYNDEFIEVIHYPKYNGMTFIKIKKKKDYAKNISEEDWQNIIEKRNYLIRSIWNENNIGDLLIDLKL
jgi:predicted O-methyltransferase YrrM